MSGHYEKGLAFYNLNRFEEAIREFQLCVDEFPDAAEPLVMLAWCECGLENPYPAAIFAQESVKLEPENFRCWQVMGYTFALTGQYPASENAFLMSLRLAPSCASTHSLFAWFLAERFRWKQAREEIEIALSYEPEDAFILAQHSRILSVLRDSKQAKASSMKALAIQPESARSHFSYGLAIRDDGRIDTAFDILQEAFRIDPSDKQIKEELIETARGRYLLYRWYLRLKLISQRVARNHYIAVVIIVLILSSFLSPQGEPSPLFQAILGVVMSVTFLGAMAIVSIKPVLDAKLARDERVAQVLGKRQCRKARFISGSFLVSITLSVVAVFAENVGIFILGITVGLASVGASLRY